MRRVGCEMVKTQEDLQVLSTEPEWLENWRTNVVTLVEEWHKTGMMMESLSHFIGATKATIYNWQNGLGPKLASFVAIREWLGLDFTQKLSAGEIRKALTEALESSKGLYLTLLSLNDG